MHKISPQVRFLIEHATITTKLHKQIDLCLSYQGISFTEFLIMHALYGSPEHMMRRTDLADSVLAQVTTKSGYNHNWDWGVRAGNLAEAQSLERQINPDFKLAVCPADKVRISTPAFWSC